MATNDVKDMFYMVPLHLDDQLCFAFTWEGQQYLYPPSSGVQALPNFGSPRPGKRTDSLERNLSFINTLMISL